MRAGILGGAFNPPHIGHLICAQESAWQLDLDSVMLMPVGEAPHRDIVQDAGRDARYELCRLAVESDPRIEVARLEIDRDGPSFTVETLRALRAESPESELFLILGGDAAVALPSWREPEQVLALATVAVAERGGASRERVIEAVGGLEGGDRVRFFSMPAVEVSSTRVRERVGAGRPIRYLVPEAVAAHIEEAGLYGYRHALDRAGERA